MEVKNWIAAVLIDILKDGKGSASGLNDVIVALEGQSLCNIMDMTNLANSTCEEIRKLLEADLQTRDINVGRNAEIAACVHDVILRIRC